MKPFVSVLTPTYNRAKFISSLVKCYKAQDYPHDRMEWILLDDGFDSVETIVKEHTQGLPNIRYIRLDEKLTIGAKRNILNQEAKGDILVAMDDDDYYPPERVSHVVKSFQANPKVDLAGSSELYMYYTDTKQIYKLGPYGKHHATNGTLAVRSKYAKTHTYDEDVTFAEERSFLDEYTHPMIQLNPMKVMLVMSHSDNTFEKNDLRKNPNPFVKMTKLTIQQFIQDPDLRAFYSTA